MSRPLAVDAVVIKDGKLLLVKRKDSPFRGRYALPGGYVEKGEGMREAVVREVLEETGLRVKPLALAGIYDDPGRDRRGNVSVAFLCSVAGGRMRPGSDAGDARFFPVKKLPGLAFDHGKIVADALPKARVKKVLAGGAFNIIHPGHVHFLEGAKRLGDELVVVVASDRTVRRNGKTLLFPARVRASMVGSLSCVDRVLLGDDRDMLKVVKKEKPDLIAVGYDQDIVEIKKMLSDAGIGCTVTRIEKLKGYSTKKITGG